MEQLKPTQEFYELFSFMHEFFNRELFNSELQPVMIVITRKKKSMGHYSPKRWLKGSEMRSDEISVNPLYFDKFPLVEILQTMVHEMCHQWQFHFGKPSTNYHNKEFARKMIALGLMPSDTGKPGGKTTGQSMADYPLENGPFIKAAQKFIEQKKFKHLWYDRLGLSLRIKESDSATQTQAQSADTPAKPSSGTKKTKVKYSCIDCSINLWGKPKISVICGLCNKPFQAQ